MLANLEAEQALLAALLLRNEMVARVSEYVSGDDFADPLHGRIFEAIVARIGKGEAATPITLKAQFDADPEAGPRGGAKYLVSLAGSVVTTLNAPDYARTIYDLADRRRLKALAKEIEDRADDLERPSEEVIAASLSDLAALGRSSTSGQAKRAVAESIAVNLAQPMPCYATGFPTLDNILGGGLFAGKCYGIAARKKVGKTVLLGTISHNLNRAGVKHLFVALEMSPAEIEQRNMARDLGINSVEFLKRTNPRLAQRVADYAVTVPNCTLYEAAPGASLDEIRRMVSRAVMRYRVAGIIIDYWQLVGGKGRSETEEFHLRNVAQWIADTCRREGIWALVAAQVNQEGNTRGGEGLKLACDCYFTLHREKDEQGAWLEMEESRYVLYANVGSEAQPGLWLNKHGPHFEDIAVPEERPVRQPYAE